MTRVRPSYFSMFRWDYRSCSKYGQTYLVLGTPIVVLFFFFHIVSANTVETLGNGTILYATPPWVYAYHYYLIATVVHTLCLCR